MSSPALLTLFDRVAHTVGGVGKLRSIVLDLAVRGLLIKQNPNEGTGTDSAKALQKLPPETNSGSRASGAVPFIPTDPFEVPPTWGKLALVHTTRGSGFFRDGDWVESKDQDPEGDVRLTQLADVGENTFRDRSARFMTSERARELNCSYLKPGDILIARMPDPIGRACRFPGDSKKCVTVVDVCILRPNEDFYDPSFLVLALNSASFRKLIAKYTSGTTRTRISRGNLGKLPVPLPPLAEQKRIVAKVEELMGLCDELEAAQAERERQRERLNAASLHRIAAAPDDDALRSAARFHFQIVPRVTVRPDQIAPLRQTILDLAVRGKLVEQDEGDEPTSELLVEVLHERKTAITEKIIKDPKWPTEFGASAEGPAPPEGWVKAPLHNVLLSLQTGPFGSSLHKSDYVAGGTPVINPASIQDEKIVPISSMAIGAETLARLAVFKLKAGDVILGRRGEMGRSAVVTNREAGWLCGTGSIVLKLPKCISGRFIVKLLASPSIREYLGGSSVGATMQNLNQKILLGMEVGIPPLAEQHRIVAKVDELMSLCDELEASLTRTQTESRRLLDAVMAEIQSSSIL